MKRVCKKINIFNKGLITQAILECLRPPKKRKRTDTRRLFKRLLKMSNKKVKYALLHKTQRYYDGVDLLADELQQKLLNGNLELKPIKQEHRIDPSSKKDRLISILSIEQLLFDHIAVVGLKELFVRVGEFQVSAIKGRGVHYGSRAIQKWLLNKKCKYGVKLDIKNFYGSVNRPHLMSWLRKHVKNDPLLSLISKLINTSPEGLPIGSFLSQTLANIYLSELYHLAMEGCVKVRKSGKKIRQVKHALFYMDDLCLLGTNKRELKRAVYKIIKAAKNMHLLIKLNWNVFEIGKAQPLDIMGFLFYRRHTAIRKRIFKNIRRVYIRASRIIRNHTKLAKQLCTRLSSYYGYIMFNNKWYMPNITETFETAFNTITNYASNTLYRQTTAIPA